MVDLTTDMARVTEYWDSQIIEPFQKTTIARKLIQPNPDVKGPGVHHVKVNTLVGMQAATIAYRPQRGEQRRESISLTSADLAIPYVEQEFVTERQLYDAWLNNRNVNLETLTVREAARTVAEKEDEMLLLGADLDGDGTYEIQGVYNAATTEFTTAKDFATYGNPYDAVAGALELLETLNARAEGYNLLLNTVQRNQLRISRSTIGVKEEPDVLDLLNPGGGRAGGIISYSLIPAGKGLLLPIDQSRAFMEFYNPTDVVTEAWTDLTQPTRSDLFGRVYVSSVPHCIHPEGLVRLTNI